MLVGLYIVVDIGDRPSGGGFLHLGIDVFYPDTVVVTTGRKQFVIDFAEINIALLGYGMKTCHHITVVVHLV